MDAPLAYFLTFTCHGTWLHGDQRGSVDRDHNEYGRELVSGSSGRQAAAVSKMNQPPYLLDEWRREVVLRVVHEVCQHRQWRLLAAHVRSNHVHIVVAAETPPEKVMSDIKAYASRALNQTGWDDPNAVRWTRHGSTRYLWQEIDVAGAVRYVAAGQGDMMAVWVDEAVLPALSEPRA